MSPPPLEAQGLILGVLQGLTEFLPISSSAHLVVMPRLLGWPYLGKTFDVALHFGTLLALVSHYREELGQLPRAFARLVYRCARPLDDQERTVLLVFLASLPGALGGYLLDGLVEKYLQGLLLIALASILWGGLLAKVDRRPGREQLVALRWPQALAIGCAQMAALLPGTSRSGATLSAGIALGLSRAQAARFSMLCAIPMVAGAVLFKGAELWREWPSAELWRAMACGAVASTLVGGLCLRAFLRYLENGTLRMFALYRVLFGLGLLLWVSKL